MTRINKQIESTVDYPKVLPLFCELNLLVNKNPTFYAIKVPAVSSHDGLIG